MSAPVDVLAVMDRVATEIVWQYEGMSSELSAARDAIAELIAFADSALCYVDAAASTERERHRANGAPNSQVMAQTVADGFRAALARVGGVK